jgi:hypothetical protein
MRSIPFRNAAERNFFYPQAQSEEQVTLAKRDIFPYGIAVMSKKR